MPILIVVENVKRWPLRLPDAEVVSARDYLLLPRFNEMRGAKVFNMCRRYGYQTVGYYVSLLATARAHRPLPSVSTLQDFRLSSLVRIRAEDVDAVVQRSLAHLESDRFQLSIYFGRNMAKRYDRLCQTLFNQFPAPFLRADFEREKLWEMTRIRAIGTSEIPETHRPFVVEQAARYFDRPRHPVRSEQRHRYDLAILANPAEENAPSDKRALLRFARAARSLGLNPTFIDKDDYGRIAEFDALFIRETTAVNHHTYRFASRAAAEGLYVIDDPESIVRCTNKVYQAELFDRHGIPSPETFIVHEDNVLDVSARILFPCVLKVPDSAFSQGVMKIHAAGEFVEKVGEVLKRTELAVAQEFVSSSFDWRIGVLGGRALYACRYFHVPGGWQIQTTSRRGARRYGKVETLAVEAAPAEVVDLAVRSARLIGEGLYGVDVKAADGRFLVMEVNDNPSIEAGVEDAVLKDELYLAVMRHILDRLERRGRRAGPP